jgi:hypothetical protein
VVAPDEDALLLNLSDRPSRWPCGRQESVKGVGVLSRVLKSCGRWRALADHFVRLVLDTNAAVSGLLWHGNPGKLIDAARGGSSTLYTSAPLFAELRGVLERERLRRSSSGRPDQPHN